MPARPVVSVCMAAYNGARHIHEQLDSILAQLSEHDEVIIVDDGSTDGTREWLTTLDDPRVKAHFNGSNLGYVRTSKKPSDSAPETSSCSPTRTTSGSPDA